MINWERVVLDLEREIVRLTKENEELRKNYTETEMLYFSAMNELAALKAQSTKPVTWILPSYLEFNGADSCLLFKEKQGVSIPLYTIPPTAAALLESLGDWVYERMQQADADYHNHGDDTAEVYATLKMVLSKIESMIESLPIIKGEKE